MIQHILNTKITSTEDAVLLNFLICDMQILRKIEEAWSEQTIREDHSNPCKKRVRRAGYLGHVYKLAHDVQEIITGKENKKYFLDWLETCEDPQFWQSFFNDTLKVGQCALHDLSYRQLIKIHSKLFILSAGHTQYKYNQ